MSSNVVTERPLAICYVHRASHRIIPERESQGRVSASSQARSRPRPTLEPNTTKTATLTSTHPVPPLSGIAQLVSIPHMRMIPVFIIITDIFGVEDSALAEVRATFRSVVKMVGFNGRGKSTHLLEVNSQVSRKEGKGWSGRRRAERGGGGGRG